MLENRAGHVPLIYEFNRKQQKEFLFKYLQKKWYKKDSDQLIWQRD